MPSHRIVLIFSWIFSYYLCLGLPSAVLIWGHCVLEIQCVNVCLHWNYYCIVTSRNVFWGVFAVSWECYTVCLQWLGNWDLFVPHNKTCSWLGLSSCYSDSIISFSKLACPQCYQPFWWFCQFFSLQVVFFTVPAILPALSLCPGKYLHVFLSTVLPAILMAVSVPPGKYLQVVYDLLHSEFVMHVCNHWIILHNLCNQYGLI
jgi:hypothetical protein